MIRMADVLKFGGGLILLVAAVFGTFLSARADDQRFDLQGPTVHMTVTRNGVTLPIAQVPTLMPNDHLQVKADLPPTQLNHLLMIVAFLRGSTNEPPNEWFTRIETWTPQGQQPTTITVPVGAQSAVVFVAPETGGDFDSLRSVVNAILESLHEQRARYSKFHWSSSASNAIYRACKGSHRKMTR